MRILVVCVVVLAALTSVPAALAGGSLPGASAPREAAVEVSLSRAQVATRLGESFDFSSRITNDGSKPLSGLVAHLNVVGLNKDIYVDPEDWSEERTKDVPGLGPGETATVSWSVKAVTGGKAAIYVVVLPRESPASARQNLAVSPALRVDIAERRTLNSGGVLPLALGVPAVIGLATIVVRRRRRRR